MSAPHPAIALIATGDTPRAITYLRALNDPRFVYVLAMLENGYPDFAVGLLEDLSRQLPGNSGQVAA